MKVFGLTDKGSNRADNQDCFIIEKCRESDSVILSLCDGMGGAKAGGIASRIADRAFVDYVYNKLNQQAVRYAECETILRAACAEANGVAYQFSKFDASYDGMGTTLVGGVLFHNGKCCLVNVGDSRAYVISLRKKTIAQVTRDHSMVADLLACGAITAEQAKHHPQRNVITRALGTDEVTECDVFHLELGRNELLLFCSDGLSNVLTDEELLSVALENKEPETLCRILMKTVLTRGAPDNVTVTAAMR